MSQQPADRSHEQPLDPADPSRAEEQPRRRFLPRYKVILHHDAARELMFVVRTVMELTRFCRAEATHKMWEAHHCGRSVLLSTYRERAELFVEQFADRGLKVSMEAE
ncbi:MAG: ATP-dependent Clp protease adaptor ClpS [Gemmataceae bacterium]|nr:ATP-dependent Clp protease adaptor ClpS [Gemmataceae bacterium]